VQGTGYRVQGVGYRVWGAGFRESGIGVQSHPDLVREVAGDVHVIQLEVHNPPLFTRTVVPATAVWSMFRPSDL
jgi:hypothetical protein